MYQLSRLDNTFLNLGIYKRLTKRKYLNDLIFDGVIYTEGLFDFKVRVYFNLEIFNAYLYNPYGDYKPKHIVSMFDCAMQLTGKVCAMQHKGKRLCFNTNDARLELPVISDIASSFGYKSIEQMQPVVCKYERFDLNASVQGYRLNMSKTEYYNPKREHIKRMMLDKVVNDFRAYVMKHQDEIMERIKIDE